MSQLLVRRPSGCPLYLLRSPSFRLAMDDELKCSVCLQGYEPGAEREGLTCGCVFHAECMANMVSNMGVARAHMRCPVCRTSADAIHDRERELRGETSADAIVMDRRFETQVIESVGRPEGEEVDLTMSQDFEVWSPLEMPTTPTRFVPRRNETRVIEGGDDVPPAQEQPPTPAAPLSAREPSPVPSPRSPAATQAGSVAASRAASPEPSPVLSPRSPAASQAGSVTAHSAASPQPSVVSTAPSMRAPMPGVVEATQLHPFPKSEYVCSLCGGALEAMRFRCITKGSASPKFRCSTCLTKLTQLNRKFGQWPTNGFKGLSEEEQEAFYKEAKAITSADELHKFAESKFTRFDTHRKFYANGGEFLPLGVWGTRGFDIKSIEENSTSDDVMMHKVLGKVYRVVTLSSGHSGENGTDNRAVIAGQTAPPAAAVDASAAPPAAAVDAEGKQGTTSSSSSSSDDKKKKKKKKCKKEKTHKKQQKDNRKAKEKAAEIKKDAAENKKRKLAADKILTKMAKVLTDLRENINSPATVDIPDQIMSYAKGAHDALANHEKVAKLVSNDPATNRDVVDPTELADCLTTAKQANATITNTLTNIARIRAGRA
jgi:hypothetical protein